ncbi:hypothetical protein BGZ72_005976 [Mortierella alpina]|nr:hypothetical protein BGZ72_005976 [Mortierella alpina]
MAIPPTTADQLPMVVPQTPMSPDRLVPAIHSTLLQSPFRPSFALSDVSTGTSSTISESSSSSSAASTSFSQTGHIFHERADLSSNANSSSAQRSSTSSASSSSASPLVRRCTKGKEKAEPQPSGRHGAPDADNLPARRSAEYQAVARTMSPVSPPSSPPTRRVRQDIGTHNNSIAPPTLTNTQSSVGGRQKSFPSPPPSPTKAISTKALPNRTNPQKLPQLDTTSYSVVKARCESKSPSRAIKHIHAIPAAERRHDIVLEFIEGHHDKAYSQESATSPQLSTEDESVAQSEMLSGDRYSEESTGRDQKTVSMVVDASGFPVIPSCSLPPPRRLSKRYKGSLPVKNAPWAWHQDGIHRQRLESHQILTKEQVFEQFHLDLDQDGPNGFFLFKLVKKFKRQDSSVLGITSSLLDAEISASPTSSPSSASPSASFLDSIDAVSVSQKLKRQLLLQKRKKQRKASSSDSEEDENLEALLSMSSHNTSLQNLNLQEVMDAYDSLKGTEEWGSLTEPSREYTASSCASTLEKPQFPDSDGEYTSRDKAVDVEALERSRGVYATGRLDGMNLVSKKRFKALQRRSSLSTASRKTGTSPASPPPSRTHSNDPAAETTPVDGPLQFKKQAISQLHIYSKNGLKFKFDVMDDNELHFVEASKKYTFMDPLAAHQQPDLDLMCSNPVGPARASAIPHPPPGHNNTQRISSATTQSGLDTNRTLRRNSSAKSKSTMSSSGYGSGNRRVFVTRLGRHTLLTYGEYKILTKSASSFTLGAKLLLQRSIAVATPNFYGSSSSGAPSQDTNGHNKNVDQSSSHDKAVSPTSSTPLSASNGEGVDYFSVKKKQRALPGFASKAVAAIRSPSTPTGSSQSSAKTTRPVVTPYNPAEYKTKSLTLSASPPSSGTPGSEEPSDAVTPFGSQVEKTVGLRRRHSSSDMGVTPSPTEFSTSSPGTPMSTQLTSSNPYTAPPIKRQGNQAGLKFQHLFATVHQRLQKLELDSGGSFYRSALVQWTVIEDVAELRWWRDKIGIQMIGYLAGDGEDTTSGSLASPLSSPSVPQRPAIERSSFVSTQSYISDASSSSGISSASGYRSKVSVERLGYRFLRVSGHMGTLKVTVSEQVEARAVALAVKAEMLRQQKMTYQQQGLKLPLVEEMGHADALAEEQPWVEMAASFSDSDSEVEAGLDADADSDLDPALDLAKQARVVGDAHGGDAHSGNDSDIEGHSASGAQAAPEGKMKATHKNKRKNEKKASGKQASFSFYDAYEYDEWTGRTRLKKVPSADRFSRRGRHDRKSVRERREEVRAPLIERMTMIVSQTKAFKGDWYMKNVYKFQQ